MKDTNDKVTLDMYQEQKRLGRPVTGKAQSNADRQRAYRQRVKKTGYTITSVHPLNFENTLVDALQDDIRQLRAERDFYMDQLRRYCLEAGDDFDKLFKS